MENNKLQAVKDKETPEAPVSLEQIKMMLMMVGGVDGLKGWVNIGVPYAEDGLKALYKGLRETHKDFMEEKGLTSIGHTFLDTPKGLGVCVFAYKFYAPVDGIQKPAEVSYPLEQMTLKQFCDMIMSAIFNDETFKALKA